MAYPKGIPADLISKSYKNEFWQQLVPEWFLSEGLTPSVPLRPAPYLPVQLYDQNRREWLVLLSGKIVTVDSNGDLVPMNIGKSTTTLAYSTNDVGLTRKPDGTLVTSSDVGTKLDDSFFTTYSAHVKIPNNYPIGVLFVPAYRWGGGFSTPAGNIPGATAEKLNFFIQNQVAVLTNAMVRIPRFQGAEQSESIPVGSTKYRLAAVPDSSIGVSFSGAGATDAFNTSVSDVSDLDSAGEYYINYATGWIYWVTETTDVVTVSYTPASDSPFVYYVETSGGADQDIENGAYVTATADGKGNWTRYTGTDWRLVVGQVWRAEVLDTKAKRQYLDLVRTPSIDSLTSYRDQPGAGVATQGQPVDVHMTNAIDTRVMIRLVK
jgi:hypothetical protein